MLTPRENLLETIRGGNPDRFVQQYEPFKLMFTPGITQDARPVEGGPPVVNAWGITNIWPAGNPGPFPVHTPADKIVIQDICEWRDYLKAPPAKFSEAEWEACMAAAEKVDRSKYFVTAFIAPGIFEKCHELMEMQETLMNFYDEPDDMKDLINYLAEWEMELADDICAHIHPDALFHHDDWGSQTSTFLSPAMFEEFFLEPYKNVYGRFKENGVQLVVHHSDSYARSLVPYMIEMGIDIWQGPMNSNNIPEMIQEYGRQISFMGGIDSASVDYEGWTKEVIAEQVKKACDACGKLYFIPCASQGDAISSFPGVYEALSEAIGAYSREVF